MCRVTTGSQIFASEWRKKKVPTLNATGRGFDVGELLGMPLDSWSLRLGGQTLPDDCRIRDCEIEDAAQIEIVPRLLGGEDLSVTVQPRVQKETWSLYWKESMNTKTESLDAFDLTVDDAITVAELQV